ncbi:hypothetical protein [Cyanobium sp. NS01]|uniref:hypothetical protein n=1 Tax=Cyanobium sp. NS01 TaxID=261284 RepID=UPI0016459E0F|nr:hypothetical protein [Cyanobium sp. NS01]QNI70400.1 circadian oscillating COP23 family protein [Cyanobium sp. NS01]
MPEPRPAPYLPAPKTALSPDPAARRWRQLLASAALAVGLPLALPAAAAAMPASGAGEPGVARLSGEAVYGFGCVEAEGSYWIGLGLIPKPSFNVVTNPMAVPALSSTNLAPVAEITGAVGAGSIAHRCTSIATRLTNLALATGTASPLGILTLTEFLQAGMVAGQPVIAIGQLALPDVLATLPQGSDPQQALDRVSERIRAVSTGPAIAEVLLREGLVEFVEVPLD